MFYKKVVYGVSYKGNYSCPIGQPDLLTDFMAISLAFVSVPRGFHQKIVLKKQGIVCLGS